MKTVRRAWPALLSLACLLAVILFLLNQSLAANGGELVYALDDAYIHLAIAKNLVRHGTWGLTKYGFTSSSSSLLWPLLLAGCMIVVGATAGPLLVNVGSAVVLVLTVDLLFLRGEKNCFRFLVLLSSVLLVPVPPLVFTGMEHVLHSALSVAACALSATLLSEVEGRAAGRVLALAFVMMALAAVRYEGLLLVAPIVGLFLLRRRYITGFLLAIAAFVPAGIYGCISFSQGWMPLPNSVLLKCIHPSVSSVARIKYFMMIGISRGIENKHLLCLLVVNAGILGYLWTRHRSLWDRRSIFCVVFLVCCILHLQLARVGWFYRYEAYLVVLGILGALPICRCAAFGAGMSKATQRVVAAAIVILVMVVLGKRAMTAHLQTAKATNDRLYEHLTPARFVGENYNNSTVAANDVGALAFFSDCRILDLYGLASMEPLRYRLEPNGYTREDVRSWASNENARIAIVQTEWREVSDRIPNEWQKVGEWEIPRTLIFGDRKIGFYSITPCETRKLSAKLRSFSARLPPGIKERGVYLAHDVGDSKARR